MRRRRSKKEPKNKCLYRTFVSVVYARKKRGEQEDQIYDFRADYVRYGGEILI